MSAACLGAKSACGVDLPANLDSCSRIFHAARESLGFTKNSANIGFEDLAKIKSIDPYESQIVFSYWESIEPVARSNLIKLVSTCPFTEIFICSKLPGDTEEIICNDLNSYARYDHRWSLAHTLPVSCYRSTMHRTVNIFTRKPIQIPSSSDVRFPSDLAVCISLDNNERALRSGINYDDLLKMGRSLHQCGFSNFQSLGHGGFGYVVKSQYDGKSCVLKFSLHPRREIQDQERCQGKRIQEVSDESLFREYDALLEAKRIRKLDRSSAVSKLIEAFGKKSSALAEIRIHGDRMVAVLVMEACWGDCVHLRQVFRDEYMAARRLSPNCRLFFRELYRVLDFLHHELCFAHLDVKWSNILLVKEWIRDGVGAQDPVIRLTDLGASMMISKKGPSAVRKYLRPDFKISNIEAPSVPLASKRARNIVQKTFGYIKSLVENKRQREDMVFITEAMLQSAMTQTEYLQLLTSGTPGYRPKSLMQRSDTNDQACARSTQKATKRKPESTEIPQSAIMPLEEGQARDIYAVASMMLQIIRDKAKQRGRKGGDPNLAWEDALHALGSAQTPAAVLQFIAPEDQIQNVSQEDSLLCDLIMHTLHPDWPRRYTARQAGTHKFFTRIFLSGHMESLASSEEGIIVPSGVPSWDTATRGSNAEFLKALSIKRQHDSHGLGAYALDEYGQDELVTWYSGRLVLGDDASYLFSQHVATLEQGFIYVDGFYGAGAWPIERVQTEHSAGPVLNSNRTESRVRTSIGMNCVLDKHRAVVDINGVYRVPVRSTRPIRKGEQFFHSYPYANARSSSFRDSESVSSTHS